MRVGTARRVRARILRRALSTATALVLVATSITVPSVAATTAIPASQGTNLLDAPKNQIPAAVSRAPITVPAGVSTAGASRQRRRHSSDCRP